MLASLDAGEAAAIPLAERLGAVLLVDDGDARAVALARGLNVIGTLGVLLRAKQLGYLDRVEPVIDRVAALGMYVSTDLRARVRHAAGE